MLDGEDMPAAASGDDDDDGDIDAYLNDLGADEVPAGSPEGAAAADADDDLAKYLGDLGIDDDDGAASASSA